jgi:hypothetical protein
VENKNKLLNPILSRFCEIYVPEYIQNGNVMNLHNYSIHKNYDIDSIQNKDNWIETKMDILYDNEIDHLVLTELSNEFYENGVSCLDLIQWINKSNRVKNLEKATICICFDKIKSEYRCEKLLLLYIFDFMFLRSKIDTKCILEI